MKRKEREDRMRRLEELFGLASPTAAVKLTPETQARMTEIFAQEPKVRALVAALLGMEPPPAHGSRPRRPMNEDQRRAWLRDLFDAGEDVRTKLQARV